ncbi:hypothetical protein PCE1_002438 [Barthelona sp. PCE]
MNLHKSWNPRSMKNRRRKWEAEKKHQDELKKAEEIRKERVKRQALLTLKASDLSHSEKVKISGLDFLYDSQLEKKPQNTENDASTTVEDVLNNKLEEIVREEEPTANGLTQRELDLHRRNDPLRDYLVKQQEPKVPLNRGRNTNYIDRNQYRPQQQFFKPHFSHPSTHRNQR